MIIGPARARLRRHRSGRAGDGPSELLGQSRAPSLPFTAAEFCVLSHRQPAIKTVLTPSTNEQSSLMACVTNFARGHQLARAARPTTPGPKRCNTISR